MMIDYEQHEDGRTPYEFCITHEGSYDLDREEFAGSPHAGREIPPVIAQTLSDGELCKMLYLTHLVESAECPDELALIAERFHSGNPKYRFSSGI